MFPENPLLLLVGALVGSYLLGAINSALIISKVFGLKDPRAEGSGNPGATNVMRTTGSRWAAAGTLGGDVAKGVLAVWLALQVPASPMLPEGVRLEALAATLAVIGHMWPVYYRFRGGKGVATSAGVLVLLDLALLAMLLLTWLAGWLICRRVAAASIAAGAAWPLYALAMQLPWDFVAMGFVLGAAVVFRHRENLRNLVRGTESAP